MSEHNYGRDDYAEYSQDPRYQELNDAYMYMMLNMVSKGFKEFYRQLNNV